MITACGQQSPTHTKAPPVKMRWETHMSRTEQNYAPTPEHAAHAPALPWHGARPHENRQNAAHAVSMYGIVPARRACPWIPYGPSEQSRRAPQLGQRSWQARMSIIICPHMGHSFLLPAAIHQTPGIRLILLIPAGTAPAAMGRFWCRCGQPPSGRRRPADCPPRR